MNSLICSIIVLTVGLDIGQSKRKVGGKFNNFKTGNGTYNFTLTENWYGNNFFDAFNFYSGADPTNGFVNYLDESTAESDGLIKTTSTNAYMYADSTNTASNGRNSIRIESKTTYNSGLFILSLNHMPEGCGTWPAFWTYGPNWPDGGEIDIIEGVNSNTVDQSTLHTSDGCDQTSIINELNFNGKWATGENGQSSSNCYVDAPNQYNNAGCGEINGNSNSYGSTFNNNGGGYYVMLWDPLINNLLNIWYFDNNSVPNDISSGTTPSSDPLNDWGQPNAQFFFGDSFCPSSKFTDNVIVFDLTFCGDWAGSAWSSDSTCSSLADTCDDFVANNPSYFANAYWDVNFLRVWQF